MRTVSAPAATPAPPDSPRAVALAAAGLAAATVAAYAGTFGAPFVFDDIPAIVENPAIRRLWPLNGVLAPAQAGGLTVAGRPVVSLSLALNYAIGGGQVWSYHAFNLAVHVCAGLVLFGLVRRSLGLPAWRARFGATALPLAATIAALWLLHPLQTAAVTYIVQRAEFLAGLFYLLTLYAFVRAAECHLLNDTGGRWRVASVAACALGMATKEVMATAPLVVLLFDRTFVAGTFAAAWRERGRFYVALAATWLLLAALVLSTAGRGGTAGFGAGVSVWSYALTQCDALVRYLCLSAWPSGLVFDYGVGTAPHLLAVLPQAGVVVALLAVTVWALVRRPLVGFFGAFFFAVLAPSSSFVPVATQAVAEHRMYLALAALVAPAVLATARWSRASFVPLWGAVALGLLVTTARRNDEYASEISIWRTAAERRPENARAHNNLGQALDRAGRPDEAMRCYERALALQPRYPETHYNLGVALARAGRLADAIARYESALRFQPAYPEAHNNLGNTLVRAGRTAEALPHFDAALRLKPGFAEAHNNLGNALLAAGRGDEAGGEFRRALALKPAYPEARYNLGNAHAAAGRMAEALAEFRAALALKPDYAEAHVNAGNAALQLGRAAEAIRSYERALALDPRLGDAHYNLGSVLLDQERWADAAARFETALRLGARVTESRRALGYAFAQLGRTADAIAQLEEYLRVEAGDTAVRDLLAALRARR